MTMSFFQGFPGLGPDPVDLSPETLHLGLEFEDAADPFQVQSGCGQVADPPELLDVTSGVAPVAPTGAGRVDEAPAFVDAERLGMDTGQLGGNGDDIDGPGGRIVVDHEAPALSPSRSRLPS